MGRSISGLNRLSASIHAGISALRGLSTSKRIMGRAALRAALRTALPGLASSRRFSKTGLILSHVRHSKAFERGRGDETQAV
jgi:hypothetical protein